MQNSVFSVHGIFPVYLAFEESFSVQEIQGDYAYVLDGEGWKLFKRNGVSVALIPVETVSGLPRLSPRIDFTADKIPLDLIRRVTAWFRAVFQKYRSEAVGYLFYRPATGEWDFIPPAQTVSAASADYQSAPRREGWILAGTVHSHASMAAFHSGTDERDEKAFDGVHITVGRLDSVPEYSCSIMVQGKREKVDPSEVIDGLTTAEAIPAAWLEAIKEPAPRGFLPGFQARADALYVLYFEGKLSEKEYQDRLDSLKKEEEAARLREAERERGDAFPRPFQGTSLGGGKLDRESGGSPSRQKFGPTSEVKKGKKNKGGQHEKRR